MSSMPFEYAFYHLVLSWLAVKRQMNGRNRVEFPQARLFLRKYLRIASVVSRLLSLAC